MWEREMKCAWIPVLKSIYNYRAMYMNPIVTTNQKTRIDNKDKKEMNPSMLLKKNIKLWRKKQKEEMNRDELRKQPENQI